MQGLILAGGQSRRFGSDKALAQFKGESLLDRAIGLLKAIGLDPVIVTRDGASYAIPDSTLLFDYLPQKGPLGGIYTAMRKFPTDDFLVLTCDMPAVNAETLLALISEHSLKRRATFFKTDDGNLQPFPGIYPSELFFLISQNISDERLAMRSLLDSISEKNILSFDGPKRVLMNVNFPSDYERLRA